MNLYHTGLSELYKGIEALGDPLTGISDRINFELIRPMLSDLYENDTEKGGRPNYDPIMMVKILLLQQWYSLSDPQIEREIRDRILLRTRGCTEACQGSGHERNERDRILW